MSITFITGGNKGLGYESARRLIELGHTVYLGARDAERGKTAADELGAHFVQLDVTDDASVAAAAAALTELEGHVDVIVNNAGLADHRIAAEDVTAADMQQIYDVNVFGIVRVTHAFLPLLRASAAPVIVNVGSGLGSLGVVTDAERFESSFAIPVLRVVEGCRDDADGAVRQGSARHAHQRRRPRVHRHRSERQQRPSIGHRRYRRHRPARDHRAGWTHRHVLGSPWRRALVMELARGYIVEAI